MTQFEMESIEWFKTELAQGRDINRLVTELREQIEQDMELPRDDEEEPLSDHEIDAMLARIRLYGEFYAAAETSTDLSYGLEIVEDVETVWHAGSETTAVNALRQSFLLLMTTFDATVFDLVRLALLSDFFGQFPKFARNEKISPERMGRHRNFDEFRDELVEETLKPRYLRDLLLILHTQSVLPDDYGDGATIADVVELVLRRNIHVHNRGFVDGRYLEGPQRTAAPFNLYGFALGDFAPINESYFEKANRLCEATIRHIAHWVASVEQPRP